MASSSSSSYTLRSRKNGTSGSISPLVIRRVSILDSDPNSDPDSEEIEIVDPQPIPVSIPDVSSNSTPAKKRKKVTDESESDQNPSKKMKEKMDKCLESMECPVCMEVPRSAPIYQCRNGHLLCKKCQPKVQACPICRSPDVGCRNGMAESLVSFCFYIKFLLFKKFFL